MRPINVRSAKFSQKFIDSIKSTGFAVLTGTEVSPELLKAVHNDVVKFFGDNERKEKLKFSPETQDGYFPMLSEKAKDSDLKDLKEFHHFYPYRLGSRPISDSTLELALELEELGASLLSILQEGYGAKEPWDDMVTASPSTLFRSIHYPPLTGEEEPGAVRASAHEDINFITMLPAATESGLQVLTGGAWHDVGTDMNSIIVNIGDMVQLLTGGYYPSTTHRVVNPKENKARYSTPLFIHPHSSVQLSPEKTAGEYLEERLKELGLK